MEIVYSIAEYQYRFNDITYYLSRHPMQLIEFFKFFFFADCSISRATRKKGKVPQKTILQPAGWVIISSRVGKMLLQL